MKEKSLRGRRSSTSERRRERRSEGGSSAANGTSDSGALPSPDALKMPKTVEEAEQMVQLGERMVLFGLEGAAGLLTFPERDALRAVFSKIVVKMKVL